MNSEVCGICRDEIVSDVRTLPCKHSFHAKCIYSWAVKFNTCPYCRAQIDTPKTILELARLGIFEDECDIIERIVRDSIKYDDLLGLVHEKFVSQQGAALIVKEGLDIPEETIVKLAREDVFAEADLYSLCVDGWISEQYVMCMLTDGIISTTNYVRDIIDIVDLGPPDIQVLVHKNIIDKEYVRHILFERIIRMCRDKNASYFYKNCPYPVQSELSVLKEFLSQFQCSKSSELVVLIDFLLV